MELLHDIYLINRFPDFNAPGFDLQRYYSIFLEHNVIINAESSEVEYGDHWSPLSVKCAFRGKEFYQTSKATVAVDDTSYFIVNNGKVYSSYIRSESKVQSFTINFSPAFVENVTRSMMQRNPDGEGRNLSGLRFAEQLYPHNAEITPLLLRLRSMSLSLHANKHRIAELFAEVLERLILSQEAVKKEVDAMSPVRQSTKRDLHQRLHQAKDLIDSCFAQELPLEQIAQSAQLAPVYFLREFKKNFHLTPHQYLMFRRIEEAKHLLISGRLSVSEICLVVGYNDLSSFSKLFKSRTGFSPDQYRTAVRS
jgi:AraC-like DNA-binding protein